MYLISNLNRQSVELIMSSILVQVKRVLTNLNIFDRFRMFLDLVLSNIFPKKKGLMVFTSSLERFGQNPKYMFLQIFEEELGAKPVWITDDKEVIEVLSKEGYKAVNSNTFKAKYLILRAEYTVYDDYCPGKLNSWLHLGSKKVNLWHGFPYKQINSDKSSEGQVIQNISRIYHKLFYQPDFFLETSEKYLGLFPQKFRDAETICAGYPRNDIFKDNIEGSELFAEKPDLDSYILYLPTFRGYQTNEGLSENLDLQRLDNFLSKIGEKIVLKPHHRFSIEGNYENIILFEEDTDIYPLVNQSKALITDYSSIIFDYMHTENPIIRFQYDKQKYKEKRGLNPEIEKIAPGKQVKTIEDLKKALKNIDEIDTDYQDKINEVFRCRKEGLQAPHILDQIKDP